MAKLKILVEMLDGEPEPFSAFEDATSTEVEPAIRLRPPESTEDHARELAFPESTCSQK